VPSDLLFYWLFIQLLVACGENQRLRKIIHCDCDCFYASVETRDNPALRGRPLAVGGDAARRGVIATCNYEARAFGVHSAMATATALRRCPDLVIVAPNMDKYREVALQIRSIFAQFSEIIEPLSLDEAYLDVSGSTAFQGSATRIAQAIRQQVSSELGITISAGVAPNKFLAKVASDWNKPDGLTVITPAQVDDFVLSLPVSKIHGVGKVMAARMAALDIYTCADLRQRSMDELQRHFGKFGQQLYDYARGIDQRDVKTHRQRKSLSVENTYAEDIEGVELALAALPALLDELKRRLSKHNGETFTGVFVKLKAGDFRQTTIERRCDGFLELDLFETLLKEAWLRMESPLRLIGVGVRFGRKQNEGVAERRAEYQLELFDPGI
jgi:DNA polymerase-4|tara:strand:- start:1508 stop:2659 length:1152 start_codon:yes stop_codon:yes gene_type:complete